MTTQPEPSALSPVDLQTMKEHYADLLVRVGVNLQPGQSLTVNAEHEHADLARLVVATAYRHGARYVHLNWRDDALLQTRILHSDSQYLEYVPEFEVARLRQQLDQNWASIHLVGSEAPGLLDHLEPSYLRRTRLAFRRSTSFFQEANMAHRLAWSIGAVPTRAWAAEVFPDLPPDEAVEALWRTILHTVRADQPDPVEAWVHHDTHLRTVAGTLMSRGVAALHFLDPTPGEDGRPVTDFEVGLTESPCWVGGSSEKADGVRFMPNMPTEEVFTTPHNGHAEGYARTTKPAYVFGCRVEGATFRFVGGQLTEVKAAYGEDRLQDLFTIPGANRLGEVALVDVRSPVNQSGVTFHETLFDENCACHIAFGKAYPGGVVDGASMTQDELAAAGVNDSEVHIDFMIGSPTMQVMGIRPDGTHVEIMRDGKFTESLLAHEEAS